MLIIEHNGYFLVKSLKDNNIDLIVLAGFMCILSKNFTDTFLKMVKFNTINLIYDGLIDSMRNAIEVTKEFNTATTELRKVSDLEGESLREYTRELAEYGATVGRTMTDMVNSATVFKRTGATDEEAKELLKACGFKEHWVLKPTGFTPIPL